MGLYVFSTFPLRYAEFEPGLSPTVGETGPSPKMICSFAAVMAHFTRFDPYDVSSWKQASAGDRESPVDLKRKLKEEEKAGELNFNYCLLGSCSGGGQNDPFVI